MKPKTIDIPRVSILRPSTLIAKWADAGLITPPLGPAYIAGSLSDVGIQCEVVDGLGEAPNKMTPYYDDSAFLVGLTPQEMANRVASDTNIIGVSCTFSHDWPVTVEAMEQLRVRFPDAWIIVGGEHITAMPEYSLENCKEIDICVLGEGEETMVELVRTLCKGGDLSQVKGICFRGKDGKVETTGRRGRIKEIDAIPKPKWDATPLQAYLDRGLSFGVNLGPTVPMLATRGCPYQCTFCSSPTMWTTKWSARSPESVLDELESYMLKYKATNFDFYDLTMVVRRDWILKFAALIKDRGLKFTWQLPSGTRSEAIDREVARALYETGCRNISYAPESGSPEELKRIKKKVSLDKMLISMRDANREGLNIKANIIIGFPGETRKDVFLTLKLLAQMAFVGVHDVSVAMFSPYPGSELFADLQKSGKVKKLDKGYFIGLTTYKDISSSINWCDTIGEKELALYRTIGLLIFYGLAGLVRPWRLVRSLRNVWNGKEESRAEKSFIALLNRTIRRKPTNEEKLAA